MLSSHSVVFIYLFFLPFSIKNTSSLHDTDTNAHASTGELTKNNDDNNTELEDSGNLFHTSLCARPRDHGECFLRYDISLKERKGDLDPEFHPPTRQKAAHSVFNIIKLSCFKDYLGIMGYQWRWMVPTRVMDNVSLPGIAHSRYDFLRNATLDIIIIIWILLICFQF